MGPMRAAVQERERLGAVGGVAAVTGSSLAVGVAGVAAPLAWCIVPVTLCGLLRWRPALLVCSWTAVCITVSIFVPYVPGHRSDPLALLASATALSVGLLLARRRDRGGASLAPTNGHHCAVRGHLLLVGGMHDAVLYGSGVAGSIAVCSPSGSGVSRVLVGEVQGQVNAPDVVAAAVGEEFQRACGHPGDLRHVALVLDVAVSRLAPHGHVSAALVELPVDGPIRILRAGTPSPLVRDACAAPHPLESAISDPLGMGSVPWRVVDVPAGVRLAVVTDAFAFAHPLDWHGMAAESLDEPGLIDAGRMLADSAGPTLVVDTYWHSG